MRNAVTAKGLELQELEHGRVQRLGNAIDLVEKQDARTQARLVHVVIDRGDDLAHGVFGGIVLEALEVVVNDTRQAQRALARVVRHGI